MASSSDRRIPAQRLAQFPSLAAVTRERTVVIVCRNRDVARQYRRGIAAAGGKTENLSFVYIPRGTSGRR